MYKIILGFRLFQSELFFFTQQKNEKKSGEKIIRQQFKRKHKTMSNDKMFARREFFCCWFAHFSWCCVKLKWECQNEEHWIQFSFKKKRKKRKHLLKYIIIVNEWRKREWQKKCMEYECFALYHFRLIGAIKCDWLFVFFVASSSLQATALSCYVNWNHIDNLKISDEGTALAMKMLSLFSRYRYHLNRSKLLPITKWK